MRIVTESIKCSSLYVSTKSLSVGRFALKILKAEHCKREKNPVVLNFKPVVAIARNPTVGRVRY